MKKKRRTNKKRGKTQSSKYLPVYKSRRMKRTQPRIVTIPCDSCEDGSMDMDSDLKRRDVSVENGLTYLHDEKVVESAGIMELGFECPSCSHWHHIFFDDEYVRALREAYRDATRADISRALANDHDQLRQDAEKLKEDYWQAFESLNVVLRAATGIVPMSRVTDSGEEE